MPKRHRQPEPIDIIAAGLDNSGSVAAGQRKSESNQGTGRRPHTGESLVNESPSDAVFPATPSTLTTQRAARRQATRAATDIMEDYGDISSSAEASSVKSEPASGEVEFDSSELGDDGNQEDDSVADIHEEDSDADGDYEAFLGRAGGQVRRRGARQGRRDESASSDSRDAESDGYSETEEEEEESEGVRRGGESEGPDSASDSADDTPDEEDSEFDSEELEEDEEDESDEGADKERLHRRKLRKLRKLRKPSDHDSLGSGGSTARGEGDDDDDDDDDDETDGAGREVTVDFGVYDMKKSHIDAVAHLMDQLCPDKMDEVDRDDLGAALAENPYTYVVKVNDSDDDENDDDGADSESEEAAAKKDAGAEIYGLASALDVAHGMQTHPAAFKALHKLLQGEVWRTVAPGIPPADVLLSTASAGAAEGSSDRHSAEDGRSDSDDDDGKREDSQARAAKRSKAEGMTAASAREKHRSASAPAKCLLLVSEYIRNVPIELTVQILDDLVNRVESDAAGKSSGGGGAANDAEAAGKRRDAVRAIPGCMYAVLAKVQRMAEPPVALVDAKKLQKAAAATAPSDEEAGQLRKGKKGGGAVLAKKHGSEGAKGELLDLRRYAFWREEDNILFDFRDKRVATLAYKCRSQYEGQPEQDIPISLLFALQHGALRQAIAEMKRRATISTDVTRF